MSQQMQRHARPVDQSFAAAADVADRLFVAERTATSIAPVRHELPVGDLAAAYHVQSQIAERRVRDGDRRVGYKVGLTSTAVQRQLGVDRPDFGTLFARMAYLDGAQVDRDRFIRPRVEAEVAFVLCGDLDHDRHTAADVLRATAFVLPALEIVDSRIADWDITLVDTVADNGSAAAYVLGSVPVPLSSVDLRAVRMTLTRRGQTVSAGDGAACLGHPINAAVWLADTQVRHGQPLRAGDVILTGALGPMVDLNHDDDLQAHLSGLGTVAVTSSPNGPKGAPMSERTDGHERMQEVSTA